MYGYDEVEFLQLDIRQLRLSSDREALDARVDEALQLEKPSKYIVTHVRKNGQGRHQALTWATTVYSLAKFRKFVCTMVNRETCVAILACQQIKLCQY